MILSIVNKAVSNFFHFSAENSYLFGIHKIIALAGLVGTVTGAKDGLMSKSGFIERGDISDANTRFSGFLRTPGMPNTPYPSEHGILVSISTSAVCLQYFLRGWPVELYWRSYWDYWNEWKKL